jgi:hypothetical protein
MNKDKFIVICNGPSLEGFNFDKLNGHTSIALNASYRKFEEIGFSPTYYCSADERVGVFHADQYAKIAETNPNIKKFFLLPNACRKFCYTSKNPEENHQKLIELSLNKGIADMNMDKIKKRWTGPTPFSTGYIASLIGISLGFKHLILLGADCNYTEFIKECKRSTKGEGHADIKLEITETPENNPNYWFGDYQQKGDEYHVPNGKTTHMKGWLFLSELAALNNIKITNCSEISQIPFFEKSSFKEAISLYWSARASNDWKP